jgi:ESS family glutamate:Na+ symporter
MTNFWDYDVWSRILLFGVVLGSLLVGNILKKGIPLLRRSLIPTSVIGGVLLLITSSVFKAVTGEVMFDTAIFGGDGMDNLEIITYHALALGFIASSFKTTGERLTGKRANEIFNTGVTTVSTYLLQLKDEGREANICTSAKKVLSLLLNRVNKVCIRQ